MQPGDADGIVLATMTVEAGSIRELCAKIENSGKPGELWEMAEAGSTEERPTVNDEPGKAFEADTACEIDSRAAPMLETGNCTSEL